MTATGLSLIAQTRSIQRSAANLQQGITERGSELSTGLKFDLTGSLGSQIHNYMDIKNLHQSLERREQRLTTGDSRIATMQNAMQSIREQVQHVLSRSEGRTELYDDASIKLIQSESLSSMLTVASSLNTNWGGRYLFSGDAVDSEAIADDITQLKDLIQTKVTDFQNTLPNGAITNSADLNTLMLEIDGIFDDTDPDPAQRFGTIIYSGGDGDLPGIEIADNLVIEYGVKADDSMFREGIKGMAMLAAMGTIQDAVADHELLIEYTQSAVVNLRNSHDDIINREAVLGYDQQRIHVAQEGIQVSLQFFAQQIVEYEGADPYESAIALQTFQTQLQSSFYVTSQIMQNSLLNYLQ